MADSTVMEEGQALDRLDIMYAVRETAQEKDLTENSQSASWSRVNEFGGKLGVAKKEQIFKSSRRMITKNECNQLLFAEGDLKEEIGAPRYASKCMDDGLS